MVDDRDPDLSALFGDPFADEPERDDEEAAPPKKARVPRRKGARITDFTLEEIAAALGGSVTGDGQISCPGPGHSEDDRSLSVKIDAEKPDGFAVYSHAGDDWRECRDYVAQELGLSLGGKPRKPTRKEQAEREARRAERAQSRANERARKLSSFDKDWNDPRRTCALDTAVGDNPDNMRRPAVIYLHARGLDAGLIDDVDVRFQPPRRAGNKLVQGALIARIRDFETNAVVGYHRTFIDQFGRAAPKDTDDGPRKREALVTSAGYIMLRKGDNPRRLCLGEGLETALSLLRLPECEGATAVALVCVGNFEKLTVPKIAEEVFIAVDIEPSGAGRKAAETLAKRLVDAGLGVSLIYPIISDDSKKCDTNDVIQRPTFKAGVDYEIKRIEPPTGVRKAPTDHRLLEECILQTLFAGECDSAAAETAKRDALGLIERHASNCGLSDADTKRLRDTVNDFERLLTRGVSLGSGWHYRGFFMLPSGLVALGNRVKISKTEWIRPQTPVCQHFEIVARSRDPHGDGWGLVIAFADGDGFSKELVLSPSDINGLTAPFGVKLRDGGLCCKPSRVAQLVDYLTSIETVIAERRRIVERGGWHTIGGHVSFVTPGGTIGDAGGERVVLLGDAFKGFAVSRALDEWREHVAKPAGAHRLLRLAISTVFSGSLLKVIDHASGGIHLKGNSSLGKTTALAVAASIWGKGDTGGGFIHQWNTTANALEGAAALLSDTALVLDEMSQASPHEVTKIVMSFGNESGKARMRADTTLRRPKTWRAALLSSGNVGIAEAMDEGNRKYRAATSVRLVEIDADAKRGFGIFDGLDATHASAARQADALRQAACKYYGTAGPAFVSAIIERGCENVAAEVRALVDAFVARHVPTGASGQVYRVAERLAVIAAAGELATALGVLPWEPGATEEACAWALQRWIGARGGVADAEERDALQQVRRLLQMYGESRFVDLCFASFRNDPGGCLEGATTSTGGRDHTPFVKWGLRKGKGAERRYLIPSEIWESEFCAGFNARDVAQDLKRRGFLRAGSVKNIKCCWKIDGLPNWGYEISASIFDDAPDGDSDD